MSDMVQLYKYVMFSQFKIYETEKKELVYKMFQKQKNYYFSSKKY